MRSTMNAAENAAVEFDIETLRPTYRLLIGQFGMSNALKIARRLKMPRDLLKRAHRYLKRRQRRDSGTDPASAKTGGSRAGQSRGNGGPARRAKQRDEYARKLAEFEQQQREAAAMRKCARNCKRAKPFWVPKYDKHGRIVRVDGKHGAAVVSLGLGQWEVTFEEIFPKRPC